MSKVGTRHWTGRESHSLAPQDFSVFDTATCPHAINAAVSEVGTGHGTGQRSHSPQDFSLPNTASYPRATTAPDPVSKSLCIIARHPYEVVLRNSDLRFANPAALVFVLRTSPGSPIASLCTVFLCMSISMLVTSVLLLVYTFKGIAALCGCGWILCIVGQLMSDLLLLHCQSRRSCDLT